MSLDRRAGELSLTLGTLSLQKPDSSTLDSTKSQSSLSKSEGTVYDVSQAERNAGKIIDSNANNNGTGGAIVKNGNGIMSRKKWQTDKTYFLAKELLMTERTFKKDLVILNTWFRDEVSTVDNDCLQPLFQLIDAMLQHHTAFLKDLEQRLLMWESGQNDEFHRIGDIMMKNSDILPIYDEYLDNHFNNIHQLHELYDTNENFQQMYKDFEQQKLCYIPVGYLLLKPLHRLLHYKLILTRLLDHYDDNNVDRKDCDESLELLTNTTDNLRKTLPSFENFEILWELQKDLCGFDKLVQFDRILIRQGCLLKHSKRGLQQRMFFLFSDVLLYGSKSPVNQTFKILGHVPVRSLLTENAEHNTFVIYGGQRAITVSAGTPGEKILWLAELGKASTDIKSRPHVQLAMNTLKNCSSSEEGLETCGINLPATGAKMPITRGNAAIHVCWHRGATVGLRDHLVSGENQISGYLLRKFKNSSGWQKLWVVFSSFCLFFYKNYQDEFALASLPLLGYSVGPPSHQDTVQKEFVFKLSFKNHIYFFRAESEHTYNRWLEVLSSTTQSQDFKNISAN